MAIINVLSEKIKKEVMVETWGHLAPKSNEKYPGAIIFVHGIYGDMAVITSDFRNLPESPWFFEDQREFVMSRNTKAGNIYRFDGTYIKFKNGNFRFTGKTKRVVLNKNG